MDGKAKYIANLLSSRKKATKLLLDYIGELYTSEQSVKDTFKEKDVFESAYHNPVTSEMEFLIARIFYHYSKVKNLGWEIYLRRQKEKTVPDVRVEKDGRTIAIVETKAKIGWMQGVFTRENIKKVRRKFRRGERGGYDQDKAISDFRKQIEKHCQTHRISKSQYFLLLPSVSAAHRRRSKYKVEDYEKDFIRNSGLPNKENFVLLSGNLEFDAEANRSRSKYMPTEKFEKMIRKIEKWK